MNEPSQKYMNLRELTLLDIMLPENNIKSGLSSAYLRAVTNIAGYSITVTDPEADFGIDATITELDERHSSRKVIFDTGKNLQIQLKCTTQRSVRETEDQITYDLSNKTYNDLAYSEVLSPRILVLFIIPDEKEEWLSHNIERLILKKCAYWTSLYGLPQKPNEDSTTAIHINKTRAFSPESLKAIMEKVSSRGNINDL